MKRKRTKETRKNRPARTVGLTTAVLYQGDLDYLKERGIPMSRALRVALMEYVLDLKAKEGGRPALHAMTKADRDAWILATNDDHATRPVPVLDAAAVPAAAMQEIPHELAPDMRSMTKDEQVAWLRSGEKADMDTWILLGKDGCTIRPEPAIAPSAVAVAESEILQGPAPDMSTWTKAERDQWILSGDVPVRAMKASAPAAGARLSMDCTEN